MNSILETIKAALGIDSENESFNIDLIIYINMAFMILHQLGVGPTTCYSIVGSSEEWSDFLDSRTDLAAVKSYIIEKVRLAFDPPQHGFLVDSRNKIIQELEWRLNVQAESTDVVIPEEE